MTPPQLQLALSKRTDRECPAIPQGRATADAASLDPRAPAVAGQPVLVGPDPRVPAVPYEVAEGQPRPEAKPAGATLAPISGGPQAQSKILLPDREARFRAFHEKNPQVYALLVRYAREALAAARRRGRDRIGMRLLWERARYELLVSTDHDRDEYAFNDHHPPYYSRLLMEREPDLKNCFETRGR